ncbi:hypothetical protein BSV1_A027 (plasmid) [Borreliella finlandensis]|uniref:Uncharacterized protein n=1 Tax=Borreliella finlandensis TaxID=498741 RepID=A0A806CB98_9SPIR|nr:hypothetical protein BSV1_A027 [Borreliella finlandensis]
MIYNLIFIIFYFEGVYYEKQIFSLFLFSSFDFFNCNAFGSIILTLKKSLV